jgi:hypothetical protein
MGDAPEQANLLPPAHLSFYALVSYFSLAHCFSWNNAVGQALRLSLTLNKRLTAEASSTR